LPLATCDAEFCRCAWRGYRDIRGVVGRHVAREAPEAVQRELDFVARGISRDLRAKLLAYLSQASPENATIALRSALERTLAEPD
jgi:hypothetical protein